MVLRDDSRAVSGTQSEEGDPRGCTAQRSESGRDAGMLGRSRRGDQGVGNGRSLGGTPRTGHHAIRSTFAGSGRRGQGEGGPHQGEAHRVHPIGGPQGGTGEHQHQHHLHRPQRQHREAHHYRRRRGGRR